MLDMKKHKSCNNLIASRQRWKNIVAQDVIQMVWSSNFWALIYIFLFIGIGVTFENLWNALYRNRVRLTCTLPQLLIPLTYSCFTTRRYLFQTGNEVFSNVLHAYFYTKLAFVHESGKWNWNIFSKAQLLLRHAWSLWRQYDHFHSIHGSYA